MSDRSCPLLIAHRGDSTRAPENTVAGVRTALEARPDLIEVDVHLSVDGHPVVIHDDTLDRTTTGAGPVSQRTLGELQGLDAGSWFSSDFAGEPLPTLEAVHRAAGHTRLVVELKGDGTGTAVGNWAVGVHAAVPCFVSFKPQELRALKGAFPEAEMRLLTSKHLSQRPMLDELMSSAVEIGCVGLSVRGENCPAGAVGGVQATGLDLWVWTLNHPWQWETFVEAGADGITTDRPLELDRFLTVSGLRPSRAG